MIRAVLSIGSNMDDRYAAERRRTRKWGPRTLDVDIIQVIDANGVELVSEDPELILPHPWAQHRAFVLVPWLAADPEAQLLGVPVREIVEKLDIADVEAVVEA